MPSSEIPHAPQCPDENALAALAEGELSGEEAEQVRAHLDACEPCRALAAAAMRMNTDGGGTGALTLLERTAARRVRLSPGTTLGRYVIGSMLGEGGMGTVYAARDPSLDRDVAIKVVASDDAGRRRLLREARAAAKLVHPNVVTIFDVGEAEGLSYVAMELIAGRSMRAFIGDGAIPLERRLAWLIAVARALAAAHRQGLVHRDIKPENVMLGDDGAIKVVDFGIARFAEQDGSGSTVTATGAVVGTPSYMAPEQLRGERTGAKADQFAWGIVAFELLCGKRPWSARGIALISQILSVDPPALDAPPALASAVRRALAKSPDARFDSMEHLIASLEGAPRRNPIAIAAGLVALVLAAAILWMATRPAQTEPAPRAVTTTRAEVSVAPKMAAIPDAAAPAPSPRVMVRAPVPSATASTKPDCDPPYTWRAGVKIPKPNCPLE